MVSGGRGYKRVQLDNIIDLRTIVRQIGSPLGETFLRFFFFFCELGADVPELVSRSWLTREVERRSPRNQGGHSGLLPRADV